MQRHTMPSVGGGGSGAASAVAALPAIRTCVAAEPPAAIRASRSRGAVPNSTTAVSAERLVSPTESVARVTTCVRRPSTPSKRTIRSAGPTRTVVPRSTPAATSASAARAVTIPARSLPGQTGWISAVPVATTTSWAWTWSIPVVDRAMTVGPA